MDPQKIIENPDFNIEKAVSSLLIKMGVSPKYSGFYYSIYAIKLAVEEMHRLEFVSKWIYYDVASRFQTNYMCIERNIRTIVNVAWENNPELLEAIAGFKFKKKPTNTEFISVMALFLIFNEF